MKDYPEHTRQTAGRSYVRMSTVAIVCVYIKSRKYLLSTRLIAASSRTAPTMTAKISGSQVRVDIPNTVPAAGGCSVSVTAIMIIKTPTDAASTRFRSGIISSRTEAIGRAIGAEKRRTLPTVQESGLPAMIGE